MLRDISTAGLFDLVVVDTICGFGSAGCWFGGVLKWSIPGRNGADGMVYWYGSFATASSAFINALCYYVADHG